MKFITLSIIIVGILIIFNFGGVSTPVTGFTMNLFMDLDAEGEDAQSPIDKFIDYKIDLFGTGIKISIWAAFVAAVGAIVLIGAKAGLFGSAPPISYYLAPFVIAFASLILTDMSLLFMELWKYSEDWMRMVLTSVFLPLSVMYLLSVKSYMEGAD